MKNKINLFRVFIVIGLAVQLVWEGTLISQYILHSDTYKPTDFSIFYTAGKIAADGKYEYLYDIETQREVRESFLEKNIVPEQVLPFNHPPLLVPILQLIVSNNYMASYWLWVIFMIIFLGITMIVINHLLMQLGWTESTRALFIISCLIFYPIFVSLLKGQDTAFLLVGASLWVYGLIAEKDPVAGIGLSLMVIRPQIALFLAIPFLFKRRKVFWWFLAGAAVLTALSVLMVHTRGVSDFIKLLVLSASGVDYEMFQNAMFNLTGLLLRIFPQSTLPAVHWVAWIAYISGLGGMCIWWRKSLLVGFVQITSILCLGMFVAPHLHYHDLALLVIAVLSLAGLVEKTGRIQGYRLAILPISTSLLLLLSDFWDPLRFSMPYAIMISLPFIAIVIQRRNAKV
jgi:hypothetical protein